MREILGKKLENKEISKKKIFLEIGSNVTSVPAQGERIFSQDELYIGIEPSPKVFEAKKFSEIVGGKKENINFIQAVGEHLPIKDNSVDELYVGNVFCDPDITCHPSWLVPEFFRVLITNGKLIIVGTNTPSEFDSKEVNELITENGFLIDKVIHPTDEAWEREIKQFDRFSTVKDHHQDKSAYIIYAIKK